MEPDLLPSHADCFAFLFFLPSILISFGGRFCTMSSAYLRVGKQLCLPVVFSLVWGTAYSVSIPPLVCVEALVSTFVLLALRPSALFSFPDVGIALSLPLCYHPTRECETFSSAAWLLGDPYVLPSGSSSTCSLVGEGVQFPPPLFLYLHHILSSLQVSVSTCSPLTWLYSALILKLYGKDQPWA